MSASIIPARSLQKSYKSIIDMVRTGNQVMILTTNNKPQAAIVSLKDLEKIQKVTSQQGTAEMLKFIKEHEAELKNLPANLREIADDILYGKVK